MEKEKLKTYSRHFYILDDNCVVIISFLFSLGIKAILEGSADISE